MIGTSSRNLSSLSSSLATMSISSRSNQGSRSKSNTKDTRDGISSIYQDTESNVVLHRSTDEEQFLDHTDLRVSCLICQEKMDLEDSHVCPKFGKIMEEGAQINRNRSLDDCDRHMDTNNGTLQVKSDGEEADISMRSTLQRSISLQNTTHDRSLFERQSLQDQLPLKDQKQVQFATNNAGYNKSRIPVRNNRKFSSKHKNIPKNTSKNNSKNTRNAATSVPFKYQQNLFTFEAKHVTNQRETADCSNLDTSNMLDFSTHSESFSNPKKESNNLLTPKPTNKSTPLRLISTNRPITPTSTKFTTKNTETALLGTPDYISPELLNRAPHGKAVDYWALGCCMYQFLVGIPPFTDQSVKQIFDRIKNGTIEWPEEEDGDGGDEKVEKHCLSDKNNPARIAIEKLLERDSNKRADGKFLRRNGFFREIEWENMFGTEVPFVPSPQTNDDIEIFEIRNARRGIVMSPGPQSMAYIE